MSNKLIGHRQESVSGMPGIGQSSCDLSGYRIGLVAYSDVQRQIRQDSPIILNVEVHLSLAVSAHDGSVKSAIEIKGSGVGDQISKVTEGIYSGYGAGGLSIGLNAVDIEAELEGV